VRLHTLGCHPTAVFGVFGGVYALAKLRGLGAPMIADAIGAAGSLSAGLNASFEEGRSTKMMHVGMAATGALRAVALAQAGVSGPRTVFDGRFGWFRSHVQGCEALRFDALCRGLGEGWEMPNTASKVSPCAFTMMPHIECALVLREQHGIRPATTWHGRISLQHTVVEVLVCGRMDKGAYAEANLRNPVINAFDDKVRHEDDPATTATRSGGTVTLRLHDGRVVTHRIDDMRGTRGNPMSLDDVVAKFLANVGGVLSASRAEATIESPLALERRDDVAAVFERLCC